MLITDREAFLAALTVLMDAKRIAVDTETSGLDVYHGGRICGISTFCKIEGTNNYAGFYFPFRHNPGNTLFDGEELNLSERELRDLSKVFTRPGVQLLLHNAKFDAKMFAAEGINLPRNQVYDTMLLSFMSNENRSHALKNLAVEYGLGDAEKIKSIERTTKDSAKKAGGFSKLSARAVAEYAVLDAEYTYRLFPKLWQEIADQDLEKLWPGERDLMWCLYDIENTGVKIDTVQCSLLAGEAEKELQELEKDIGFNPAEKEMLAVKLFGKPPLGLGLLPGELSGMRTKLFPRGIPIMDEAALREYDHPIIEKVLRHRTVSKANSTWYRGFLIKADKNQRLHTNYKQHGAGTTRFASENPNVQQLPRDPQKSPVRKLLMADGGWELWEYDYSQMELRLAACYAEEPRLIEAYRAGEDVHQLTAELVGISRYDGKQLNFSMVYGAGPQKVAELLNRSFSEAQEILERFHKAYPRLKSFAKTAERAARQQGYVRLWNGRRRHFEKAHINQVAHKAFNSVVQGGAAQIVCESMRLLHEEPLPDKYKMVMNVHDALYFEIKDGDEGVRVFIKNLMEWPGYDFEVPFPVDSKRVWPH